VKKGSKKSENKQLLELGQKQRAGQLISSYLRAIGTEITEELVIFTDPDTGKRKLISKAEALARDIWKEASDGDDPKLKLEYRKMLLDRIEGKPGIDEEPKGKHTSIPDQISEINRDKLNAIAEEPAKEES